MIVNIRFIGRSRTVVALGGQGGCGEIHGPEHQPGGGEVDAAGVHHAEDFSTVQGEVARGHGHTEPRDAGESAGTGHAMETSAGVKVMSAAGASSDGGTLAVAAVWESVSAKTDDQV